MYSWIHKGYYYDESFCWHSVFVYSTIAWQCFSLLCSLETARLAIGQLKEKIETIVGPEEPTGAEGFEVEIHESEDQSQTE